MYDALKKVEMRSIYRNNEDPRFHGHSSEACPRLERGVETPLYNQLFLDSVSPFTPQGMANERAARRSIGAF